MPISSSQQRFWILDQLKPNSNVFNTSAAIRLQGRLKLDHLISGKIQLDQINDGFTQLKSGAPVRNLIDFGVV